MALKYDGIEYVTFGCQLYLVPHKWKTLAPPADFSYLSIDCQNIYYMDLAIFLAIWTLLVVYFWKVFLHYKLLRIIYDGSLNKDEDYFVSLLIDNKFFFLKVKCIGLNFIEHFFQDATLNRLQNRINLITKLLRWSIIILLSISLLTILLL